MTYSNPQGFINQYLFSVTVDNINKLRFQRSSTHQETINIRLRTEVLAVLPVDGSTVDDPDGAGHVGANVV